MIPNSLDHLGLFGFGSPFPKLENGGFGKIRKLAKLTLVAYGSALHRAPSSLESSVGNRQPSIVNPPWSPLVRFLLLSLATLHSPLATALGPSGVRFLLLSHRHSSLVTHHSLLLHSIVKFSIRYQEVDVKKIITLRDAAFWWASKWRP